MTDFGFDSDPFASATMAAAPERRKKPSSSSSKPSSSSSRPSSSSSPSKPSSSSSTRPPKLTSMRSSGSAENLVGLAPAPSGTSTSRRPLPIRKPSSEGIVAPPPAVPVASHDPYGYGHDEVVAPQRVRTRRRASLAASTPAAEQASHTLFHGHADAHAPPSLMTSASHGSGASGSSSRRPLSSSGVSSRTAGRPAPPLSGSSNGGGLDPFAPGSGAGFGPRGSSNSSGAGVDKVSAGDKVKGGARSVDGGAERPRRPGGPPGAPTSGTARPTRRPPPAAASAGLATHAPDDYGYGDDVLPMTAPAPVSPERPRRTARRSSISANFVSDLKSGEFNDPASSSAGNGRSQGMNSSGLASSGPRPGAALKTTNLVAPISRPDENAASARPRRRASMLGLVGTLAGGGGGGGANDMEKLGDSSHHNNSHAHFSSSKGGASSTATVRKPPGVDRDRRMTNGSLMERVGGESGGAAGGGGRSGAGGTSYSDRIMSKR